MLSLASPSLLVGPDLHGKPCDQTCTVLLVPQYVQRFTQVVVQVLIHTLSGGDRAAICCPAAHDSRVALAAQSTAVQGQSAALIVAEVDGGAAAQPDRADGAFARWFTL